MTGSVVPLRPRRPERRGYGRPVGGRLMRRLEYPATETRIYNPF